MTIYDESDLRRAAEAAIRAPSLHNSQPWLFRLRDGAIEVLADPARQLAVADRAGWAVADRLRRRRLQRPAGAGRAGTPPRSCCARTRPSRT